MAKDYRYRKAIMLKNKWIPSVLLACSSSVFAAQPPSAGSQMQQIPPAPIQQSASGQNAVPQVEAEPVITQTIAVSKGAKIRVNGLKLTGVSAYSVAELLAVSGLQPGRELTLSDLRDMALRISDHYHSGGYFVAQAYLPAQDIKDGIVTIAVIEGHYGNITLHNQTFLSDGLATGMLGGLNRGDLIASAPLESDLLLLSDLPGVKVKSTLIPGASVGSSDLIVDVTEGKLVTGSVDADNAGNRYTGADRIGATVNLNDAAGLGDVATLRVLTSGSGLNYMRVSYQMQFGKAKVGVAYASMEYQLGDEFAILQANGMAQIASVYGSYPLLRSRDNNLYAQIAFDDKTFEDRTGLFSEVTDKKAHVLMSSLNGDRRDNFGAGGLSNYSLTWFAGNINILTPVALTADAAGPQSNGHYNKLGFNAARLQRLTDTVSLAAAINGQLASKNLDISEKMELGGMYAVRAYPEGEAYADQGYVLNLEARKLLPRFSRQLVGQVQFIGFVDTGTVSVNRNPWALAGGPNSRTLSGMGLGVNWADANDFEVRAYYARKLGSAQATSAPDASGRFWIQGIKYF
jgi:hemolysin activation/secretion protein